MKFKIHSQQEITSLLQFLRIDILNSLNNVEEVDYGEDSALFLTFKNAEFVILNKETEYDFPLSVSPDGSFSLHVLGDITIKEAYNDKSRLAKFIKGNLGEMTDSEVVHEIAHFLDIKHKVFTKEELDKYAGEDDIINTFKTVNVVEINAFLNEIHFINDFSEFDSFDEVVSIVINSEYDALGKERLVMLDEFKNVIQQVFEFPMSDVFPNIK